MRRHPSSGPTIAGVLSALLIGVAPGAAQTPALTDGTAVSLFAGASNASSETGGLIGAAVTFDVNARIAVEAAGTWFDRGPHSNAFRVGADVIWRLVRPGRRMTPFVVGGIGAHRMTFDLAGDPTAFEQLPPFYRDRIRARIAGGMTGGLSDTGSFTDPVVTLGAGVRITVNRYVFIRPEVKALIVSANGGTHTLGVVGMSVGFRIEERNVTP